MLSMQPLFTSCSASKHCLVALTAIKMNDQYVLQYYSDNYRSINVVFMDAIRGLCENRNLSHVLQHVQYPQ